MDSTLRKKPHNTKVPGVGGAVTRRVVADVLIGVLVTLPLAACATNITFEPDATGAQHECSAHSANLAQYNECMERVEAFYREYEAHRKLNGQDDG